MGRSKFPSMIQQELRKLTELNRLQHTTARSYAVSAPRLDQEIAIRAVRLDQSIDQLSGAVEGSSAIGKSWNAVCQNLLDLSFMLVRYDFSQDNPDDEGVAQLPLDAQEVRGIVCDTIEQILETPWGLAELIEKTSVPRKLFKPQFSGLMAQVQAISKRKLTGKLQGLYRQGCDLIGKHYRLRTKSALQSIYDSVFERFHSPWRRGHP